MRKNEAIADEDCPEDAASYRFWCTVGGKYTDREKVSVKGSSTIGVKSTASGVNALLDSSGMPGPSVTPPTTPSTVSLSTLVGLAAGEAERSTAATKAKAKGKAKSNRKKVVKEEPQTPKEKKDAARKWSIISIVFCEKRFMANVYIKCFHAETQHLFTIQKTIIKKRTIHLRQ